MKRDMELIRLLLLELEGGEVDLQEFSQPQQAYHAALLIESGLAQGSVLENADGFPDGAVLDRLTWAGHEFIDSARNERIWKKASDVISKTGVTVSFDVLRILLTNLVKERIGLAACRT